MSCRKLKRLMVPLISSNNSFRVIGACGRTPISRNQRIRGEAASRSKFFVRRKFSSQKRPLSNIAFPSLRIAFAHPVAAVKEVDDALFLEHFAAYVPLAA